MILTTLTFLYVLLPLTLAVFSASSLRLRPSVLLLASLLLYWNQQGLEHLFMMLACVLSDYGASLLLGREKSAESTRRACVLFTVAKNIFAIAYAGALLNIRMAGGAIGLAVYALSGIDYILAVYRREAAVEKTPRALLLYCCFFPRLFAGPLLPYTDFVRQLEHLELKPETLLHGAGRFVQGAVKYGLIGSTFASLYDTLHRFDPADWTVLSIWCIVLSVALWLYYTFSGLCDMAQGLGCAFGLRLPNNFYYPYQSLSIADFLSRFNMTLYRFIRRTVYVGPQEGKRGAVSDCLNILAVGALMGLWFGFRSNNVAWGMFLSVFIMLERYAYPRLLRGIPTFFARLYALCVVLTGFTIFAGDSLTQTVGFLRVMFGFGGAAAVNDKLLYLLSSNWLILLLGLLFAFSFVSRVLQLLRQLAPRTHRTLQTAVDAALLVLFTAMSL